MKYFLVRIAVTYKTFIKNTEWTVEAEDAVGARRLSLLRENHTYNERRIDKICAENNYTKLQDGVFSYEVLSVVEQQIIEVDGRGGSINILINKDTAELMTWDDVCPIDGTIYTKKTSVLWCVDGKIKKLSGMTGARNEMNAIAYFIQQCCPDLNNEQAVDMIENRVFYKANDGSGTYAFDKTSDLENISAFVDGAEYLVSIPSDSIYVGNPILAGFSTY